jgi:hypothetical protein
MKGEGMSTDERMSYRQYAKFDKVFFLYGSVFPEVYPGPDYT